MTLLACENLTVAYASGSATILNALSVSFNQGRFTALLGANGCGKSTLLKSIMLFLKPHAGSILLDGRPIQTLSRRALARRIAYLPQENHCPDYLTLSELVELGGYARYSMMRGPSDADRQAFKRALSTVGLDGMERVQVNSLSGGQRQRAWIAMVLAQDAEIILLDEPVNHLDLKYQYAVLELVRELVVDHGKTVIAVLHDVNLAAAFADDVVMLERGQVVACGEARSVITRENVQHVFDLDVEVFERDGRLVCLPHRQQPAQAVSS